MFAKDGMMEEKIQRLIRWMNGEAQPPYTLDINPTDECNLSCLSCWKRNPKFKNLDTSEYELEEKSILKYVKEGIKLGVKEFEITGGGEPLMRKNIALKLFRMIKKANRFGNITTNGTLFTKDDIKLLVKLKWDRVTLSIDGPNERVNDYLRGKGSFERIMNSVRMFNEWKKKLKSKRPVLKFNTVISNKNYKVLDKMILLAKDNDVEIVSFEKLTVHSEWGERLKLRGKQYETLEKKLKLSSILAEKFGLWTNAYGLTKESFVKNSNSMTKILNKYAGNSFVTAYCYEPWWHIVVKVDGSVQPCCLYDEKTENVKNKDLKKIIFYFICQEISI